MVSPSAAESPSDAIPIGITNSPGGADPTEYPSDDPAGSSSGGEDPPGLTSSSEAEPQPGGRGPAPGAPSSGVPSDSDSSASPRGNPSHPDDVISRLRPQATGDAERREGGDVAMDPAAQRHRARALLQTLAEAARRLGRMEAEELLAAAWHSASRCAQERSSDGCRRASCARTAESEPWSVCCQCLEDIAGPAMRRGNLGFLFGRCSTCEGICHLREEQLDRGELARPHRQDPVERQHRSTAKRTTPAATLAQP